MLNDYYVCFGVSIDDVVCLNSDDDQLLDADEVIGEIMIDWSVIWFFNDMSRREAGGSVKTRFQDCVVFAADWRLDVRLVIKANW